VSGSSILDYYGGASAGGGPDYGIVFGSGAVSAVDSDAASGATYPIANEPSPNTTLAFLGFEGFAYMTVRGGGFTALSFQYTSGSGDINVTLYAGPDLTGAVLGSAVIPGVGRCGDVLPACGDPTGVYGAWRTFVVPPSSFVGAAAGSAGFAIGTGVLFVDDMVLALVPPPTTKRPTRFPTTVSPASACPRRKRKGMMRCGKKTPKALL
jgi:hypothetical protein